MYVYLIIGGYNRKDSLMHMSKYGILWVMS